VARLSACERTPHAPGTQPCAAVLRPHFAGALFQRSRGRISVRMSASRHLVPALVLAAALCAGASRAAEPETVATAPAGSQSPTSAAAPAPAASPAPSGGIADQIDTYLKTSPALALPKDGAAGVTPSDEPRKIHGVVDVAVGTGGYRSAFVASDLPVGKTGTLSIAVGEQRFNGRFSSRFGGPGVGPGIGVTRQSLGLGLFLGDAAPDPRDLRCRQTGEDGSDLRSDTRFEGGRPRPCRAAEAQTYSPQ
jgi:hypothetical protein